MHITNFAEAGQFEPRKIAAVLRTSAEEIALTVGLGKDARIDRIDVFQNLLSFAFLHQLHGCPAIKAGQGL